MNEPTKLNELMKETAYRLKTGDFTGILTEFRKHYNEDEPDFVVIKRTIADAMVAKGDIVAANTLYVNVFDILKSPDKLGPEHNDVLSVWMDCAKTSTGITTAINILDESRAVANRTGNAEMVEKNTVTRRIILRDLTPTKKKIYKRMLDKKLNNGVFTDTKDESKLSTEEMDALLQEFGLDKY